MAIKLEIRTIGDDIPFDLGPTEATAFTYHYYSPASSQAKSNWIKSYLEIRGKINSGFENEIPVLPPWANTIWTPDNSMVEYYRDVSIEESKLDASIRKIRFPKAYVIEYREYASDQEGEMRFVLLLGQKMDCLDEVEINGEPVASVDASTEEDSGVYPTAIYGENVAAGIKEKSISPKGKGKNGNLTIDQIKDEFAKAAGYDSFADLN